MYVESYNNLIEHQANIVYSYIAYNWEIEKISPDLQKIKLDLEYEAGFCKNLFDKVISDLMDSGEIVVKKTIEGKKKIYDLDFLLEDPEKHIAVVKKIYNFLDLEWKKWQFPSVSETKNIFIRKEKISEDVFEIAISYLKEKELFIVSPDDKDILRFYHPSFYKLIQKKISDVF